MFLLSLWDGASYQADLQALLYVDREVFTSMITVLRYLYENNLQLYSLVSEAEMRPVFEMWGEILRTEDKQ